MDMLTVKQMFELTAEICSFDSHKHCNVCV